MEKENDNKKIMGRRKGKKSGRTLQIDFSAFENNTIEELKHRYRLANKKNAVRQMVGEFGRAIKEGLIDEYGKIMGKKK